jgi:hypothetical protein
MMTEEEWKAYEEYVDLFRDPGYPNVYKGVILAAYQELKERREDEEWCHKYSAMPVFYLNAVWLKCAGELKLYEAPTLHAAILAATCGRK